MEDKISMYWSNDIQRKRLFYSLVNAIIKNHDSDKYRVVFECGMIEVYEIKHKKILWWTRVVNARELFYVYENSCRIRSKTPRYMIEIIKKHFNTFFKEPIIVVDYEAGDDLEYILDKEADKK